MAIDRSSVFDISSAGRRAIGLQFATRSLSWSNPVHPTLRLAVSAFLFMLATSLVADEPKKPNKRFFFEIANSVPSFKTSFPFRPGVRWATTYFPPLA